MRMIGLGTALACLLMVMAACPSSDTSGDDGGSKSPGRDSAPKDSPGRDNAPKDPGMPDSGGDRDTASAAVCTPALGRFLNPSCQPCLEDNCQTIIAACSFDDCVRCLLSCTTCASACTGSSIDSGADSSGGSGGDAGRDASKPPGNDGGAALGDSGGAPSCEKLSSGNCCSLASFAGLGNQCQQAVSSNIESICATLLSNLQSYGVCR